MIAGLPLMLSEFRRSVEDRLFALPNGDDHVISRGTTRDKEIQYG